jgi:glycosyltransferase involved in cell wall biosynthesis
MVVTPGPPVVADLVEAGAALEASGPDEFERAVDGLLRDETRRQTLSRNATDIAAEFDWDRRVDAVDRVYQRLSTTEVR